MHKKAAVVGGVFGLFAIYLGLFFGLQVSTALGNILAFPVIALVMITETPFGMWHPAVMILATVLSIALWATVFSVSWKLIKRVKA